MRRITPLALLLFAIALPGCSASRLGREPEAFSILDGRALHAPAHSSSVREGLERQLADAQRELEEDPESEEALIWYARRLAYLGRYRESIDQYTQGFGQHPDSPRILRHRGHRYISVRSFDRAAMDLGRAARILDEAQIPDEIEPDGMPNAAGVPRSTLHSNIFYHWALSLYLQGEFSRAHDIWRRGLDTIEMNDDMAIAFLYWIHNSLVRLEQPERSLRAIEGIHQEMDILENHTYHQLLLLFKRERGETELMDATAPEQAFDVTMAYGVAIARQARGDRAGWIEMLESIILQNDQWAAFGYIAAEADLARLSGQKSPRDP